MNTADTAAAWAEAMAADDSHGYDQHSRWGPDYDCSSLVISAYKKAGLALTCTYTGNMKPDMLARGFRDVTGEIDLPTGAGLRRGDVLLNIVHHTALYLGGGRLVHAAGNERGGATGGRTGDQTGREIVIVPYFLYGDGWDCVLRYVEDSNMLSEPLSEESSPGLADKGVYIVRHGDTLWGIAERFLGNGSLYTRIMEFNKLSNSTIYPGQRLQIEKDSEDLSSNDSYCMVQLPVLRLGSTCSSVKAAQVLLLFHGERLPSCGVDGEFGEETLAAVKRFSNCSIIDEQVWRDLITAST